jgi:hypothetical protein
MNDTIRVATVIGILLIAFVLIATPVSAAAWSTQSYRFTTTLNPVSTPAFVNSQPAYLYNQYSSLNNYLSSGSLLTNTNMISVPSMATSNNNWDTLFGSPSFMYSCGCS